MNYERIFVYVNGEKVSLLEDGRLALYPRFPAGSVLYDPSDLPPREVPLSTNAAEYGVTACRLVPYAHYEVYIPDPTAGDLHPLTGTSVCAYVTNLPPNTTAEMLGRYFEAFDMVVEADVFTTPSAECTGRGWVVLRDPAKLLMIPPVMEFFPRVFIYTALSDKIPERPALHSPSLPGGLLPGADGFLFKDPMSNHHNRSGGNNKRSNGKSSGGIPKPPAAVTVSVVNTSSYYFVASIQRDELEKSVEEGIFCTSPENRRAFYATLDRGPVIIIFLLQECLAVFGYARLLPQRNTETNGSFTCAIDWMKHHVFLKEEDVRTCSTISISKMGDGVPLKPEIGECICHLADQYPSFSVITQGVDQSPSNNGRRASRGGGGNNISGGGFGAAGAARGVLPVGNRGALRSGPAATSPPQPLGTRPFTRGGGGRAASSRTPPQQPPYSDSHDPFPVYNGGGGAVPPRKPLYVAAAPQRK